MTNENAVAYATIIRDELIARGFECTLYRGIVPHVPTSTLHGIEDRKRLLDSCKELGVGAEIVAEGLFVRPSR
jgi:hypothetical protein